MRKLLAGLGMAALLMLWACEVNQDEGKITLNVKGDTSWMEFDRLIIEVGDTSGNVLDTLYNARLGSLDGLNGLPAGKYTGGPALFTFRGYRDGELVFEQTRMFDESTGKALVETTLAVSAPVKSLKAKPDSLTLYVGGGDSTLRIESTPKYARPPLTWKLEGDAATLSGVDGAYSATLKPTRSGEATLRVQPKGADSLALSIPVRVVVDTPALEVTPAKAYVEPGKDVEFKVKARQAYGDVVSLESDLDGNGSYEDTATGKWEGAETELPARKHAYGDNGIYTVGFRVKDSEGNASLAFATVIVGERKPSVTIFPKDTTISIKDEVRFRATIQEPDGKLASYDWDWNGDGASEDGASLASSSAEVKASRAFNDSGIVKVILAAKDADGKEGVDTATITVLKDVPIPDPGAAITAKSKVSVAFAGTAQQRFGSIAKYKWDFDGDGAYDDSSDAPPAMAHAYNREGEYKAVFYVRDDDGNEATAVRKVTVSDAPIVIADMREDTTISIKDVVPMTATIRNEDGKTLGYSWDYDADGTYDDTATSGSKEIEVKRSHAYPSAGTFKATLRVQDDQGKTLTDTVTITVVLDAPKAELTGKDAALIGESVAVSLKDTANRFGAIEKRELRIDGDSVWIPLSNRDTALVMPQTAGTLRVIGRVTDDDGLVGLDTLDIAVKYPGETHLSGIFLSSGTLAPAFDADSLDYAAAYAYNATSVVVGAAARDPKSSITVNGTPLTSSVTSITVALKPGANTVPIVVTAQDTSAKRTYKVSLNRALSPISTLSALVPGSDTLAPRFAAGTTAYTIALTDSVDTLRFTPTVTDTQARVTVAGTAVATGTLSQKIPVPLGTTRIDIVVTAANGTKTTYTVSVIRKGWSMIGNPSFTGAGQKLQSLSADLGIASVGLNDTTAGWTPAVWRWDGAAAWSEIVAGKFKDSSSNSVAVDMYNGATYLASLHRPGGSIGCVTNVRRYVSGTWSQVGKGINDGYGVLEYSLDHDKNNQPFLSYHHSYMQQQHFVYKLADTVWGMMSQTGAADSVANLRMVVNRANGLPVVAFIRQAPGSKYVAYVESQSGTGYAKLGTVGWPVANARVDIAFDAQGVGYYAYIDPATNKAVVQRYTNNWAILGPTNGFSEGEASSICVAAVGNIPVVAYRDSKLGTVAVKRWSGASWIDFGISEFKFGNAGIVRMAVDNTGVWVAYSEPAGAKVTVMRRPLP